MKKLMLLAYGAFFVLAQSTALAQGENLRSSYHDNMIVINLQGSDKIFFIGDALKMMVRYQKADSLKMLFLNDFERAVSENSITKEVQTVHYFVHGSGKRRLKAETPEYSDDKVDVEYEIKRLNLDLPKYQYFIHDLSSGYELQIYINDPGQIKKILENISIDDAIHYSETCKKGYTGFMFKAYKIEINTDHNNYKLGKVTKSLNDQIIFSGVMGMAILGNVISPTLGADIAYKFPNRHSGMKYKAGISFTGFNMVSMNAGKITGVSMVRSYDLRLMILGFKNSFFGIQGGFMRSNELSPFNNAWKSGLVLETPGMGTFSIDQIFYDKINLFYNKHWIYGFTWKLRLI